jgi:hypothetical protein
MSILDLFAAGTLQPLAAVARPDASDDAVEQQCGSVASAFRRSGSLLGPRASSVVTAARATLSRRLRAEAAMFFLFCKFEFCLCARLLHSSLVFAVLPPWPSYLHSRVSAPVLEHQGPDS